MVRRYILSVCYCVIDDLYKRNTDFNYFADSDHDLRNNCTCRSENAHSFDLALFTTRLPDTSDMSATQVTRMQHECNTSYTSATRVRHKRHEYDISAKRARHECYTNDTSATRAKNFDTLIFTIWQVKDYKERNNFILRTTFWKCLFSMPKCV